MRVLLMTMFILSEAAGVAGDEAAATVSQKHPYVCAGALRQAVLAELPDGIVARSEGAKLSLEDVRVEISAAPSSQRAELEKYQAHVLEQLVTKRLLEVEARAWASRNGKEANTAGLVGQYLGAQVLSLEATEQDARSFFEQYRNFFSNSSFDDVRETALLLAREDKRSAARSQFVKSIGSRHRIEVASGWMAKQVEVWARNPVEQARVSGRPSFITFSVIGCCDKMHPIVQDMKMAFRKSANVVFVNVREEPVLAAAYGVEAIPVELFFDAKGNRIYSHHGVMSNEEVRAKLQEAGG